MDLEEYASSLGKLVANLHGLEFSLRCFLQTLPTAPPFGLPKGTDIYVFPKGETVPLNEFTSYDSLNELIKKYNIEMANRGQKGIDQTIVEIRDAIAHGRISAPATGQSLHLVKFGRPKGDRVIVEFNVEMSPIWFKTQVNRVLEAIHSIPKNLQS